jgi:hypothetical protein
MDCTLQNIFSRNYYKYVLLDYGLSLGLGHVNQLISFSQMYSN